MAVGKMEIQEGETSMKDRAKQSLEGLHVQVQRGDPDKHQVASALFDVAEYIGGSLRFVKARKLRDKWQAQVVEGEGKGRLDAEVEAFGEDVDRIILLSRKGSGSHVFNVPGSTGAVRLLFRANGEDKDPDITLVDSAGDEDIEQRFGTISGSGQKEAGREREGLFSFLRRKG